MSLSFAIMTSWMVGDPKQFYRCLVHGLKSALLEHAACASRALITSEWCNMKRRCGVGCSFCERAKMHSHVDQGIEQMERRCDSLGQSAYEQITLIIIETQACTGTQITNEDRNELYR